MFQSYDVKTHLLISKFSLQNLQLVSEDQGIDKGDEPCISLTLRCTVCSRKAVSIMLLVSKQDVQSEDLLALFVQGCVACDRSLQRCLVLSLERGMRELVKVHVHTFFLERAEDSPYPREWLQYACSPYLGLALHKLVQESRERQVS